MIIRNENKRQYTKVETEIARNGTFRPEELGVYVAMLSHTDDWDFHEKALSRELNTTPEEIRGILLRLEQKGFARSHESRYGLTWDLIEKPEQAEIESDAPPEEDGIRIVKREAADHTDKTETSGEDIGEKFKAFAEKLRRDSLARKAAEKTCRNAADRV